MNQADNIIKSSFCNPSSDPNILKLRLDTSDLLERIEFFLRGCRDFYSKNETGEIVQKKILSGKPKANEDGVQALLNWLSATINACVVQGYFPEDKAGVSRAYDRYIMEYHLALTEMIIKNIYEWDIKDFEIDGVISFIMLLVQPFFSRLIGNRERESYSQSLRSEERSTIDNPNKKWGIFG